MNKEFVLFVCVLMMAGQMLLMAWTFYSAYSSPDKAVLVTINEFGEANTEAWIAVPFTLLCTSIATAIVTRDFFKSGERGLEENVKKKKNGKSIIQGS